MQTFADDYWLQAWVDKILRQQFTLTGAAQTEVENYLKPYFKTNKYGDGIQRRGHPVEEEAADLKAVLV